MSKLSDLFDQDELMTINACLESSSEKTCFDSLMYGQDKNDKDRILGRLIFFGEEKHEGIITKVAKLKVKECKQLLKLAEEAKQSRETDFYM